MRKAKSVRVGGSFAKYGGTGSSNALRSLLAEDEAEAAARRLEAQEMAMDLVDDVEFHDANRREVRSRPQPMGPRLRMKI